jgi:beta-N-acetylhexosaminidase
MHGGVFKRLIDEGVYSIMTGHICLPACQTEFRDGRFLPATLSHELSTVLLKEQLGFGGVIVSDALIMGGFIKWFDRTQSLIECFKAGTDMMLWPDLAYFDAMEKAVASGEVTMARLDDAVTRVLTMKEKLGLLTPGKAVDRPISVAETNETVAAARGVAEASLTMVRDRHGLLPVSTGAVKKVLVVAITSDDKAVERLDTLKAAMGARGCSVTMKRNPWFTDIDCSVPEYDLVVYAVERSPHRPMGPLNFWGGEAGGIWSALASGREKSVVVSFGSPYFCAEYFDAADVFVNAYSSVPATQEAVVRALFGEIGFAGTSPVNLG